MSDQSAEGQNQGDYRLSTYGWALLLLCVIIGMAEGYDVQAMALAAPMVAKAWQLSVPQVGILLTASVVGLVIGSFALTPLGDRWGRKPSSLLGLAIAGIGTLGGIWASNEMSLLTMRLIAGIGLGLALSTIVTLAMELMPTRLRTLAVVLIGCGYPLGATIGSLIAAKFIPELGYIAVFIVGGVATIIVVLFAWIFLPETPAMLARQKRFSEMEKVLRKLGAPEGFTPPLGTVVHSSPKELFTPTFLKPTILFWITNFANLTVVYYFFNWLPSLVVARGGDAVLAVKVTGVFAMPGIVGALLLVAALKRFGPTRTLSIAYIIAAMACTGLTLLPGLGVPFYIFLALTGAMMIGGQFCLGAIVTAFYPSAIRSTASGYATGAGRVGAIAAPLFGSMLLAIPVIKSYAFAIAILPTLLALIGILLLHTHLVRSNVR